MIDESLTLEKAFMIIGPLYPNLRTALGLPTLEEYLEEQDDRTQADYDHLLDIMLTGLDTDFTIKADDTLVSVIKKSRDLQKKYGALPRDMDHRGNLSIEEYLMLKQSYDDVENAMRGCGGYHVQCLDARNYPIVTEGEWEVGLTVKEAIGNAIEYGSQLCTLGEVKVRYYHGKNALLAVVEDPGNGFDHTQFVEPVDGRYNGVDVYRKNNGLIVGFERFEGGFRTLIIHPRKQ